MFDADPKLARHGGHLFNPDPLRHLVIIDVARLPKTFVQIDCAMAIALPAMELAVAKLQVAGAIDRIVHRRHPGVQCGKRRHHLEGRAGRIGALNRFVGQRPVIIFRQKLIVSRRDAAHKQVRIKTRRRGDGPDRPIGQIKNHRCGTFFAQPRDHIILQPRIQRQAQIDTCIPLAAVDLSHFATSGIDLDPAGARLAAQLFLELGLDPQLADLELGDLQQRVRIGDLRQVIVADRADIPKHMGKIIRVRVKARQADLGGDPGQDGGIDGDA